MAVGVGIYIKITDCVTNPSLTPPTNFTPINRFKTKQVVHDMTEQDVINLKRTIYLTIMSSAGFEECTHKLMKLDLKVGTES